MKVALVAVSIIILSSCLHAETLFDASNKEAMSDSYRMIKSELSPRKQALLDAAFKKIIEKEGLAAAAEILKNEGKPDKVLAEKHTFERLEKRIGGGNFQDIIDEGLIELFKETKVFSHDKSTLKSSPAVSKTAKEDTSVSGLELGAVSFKYEKGKYSQTYKIGYSLKNNNPKGVKLIKGYINFYDLLGEKVFGIRITPDVKISKGETIMDEGNYSINDFISEQMRMKDMSQSDVVKKLIIEKLVFDDNTVFDATSD